jgi:hypothetical protein
VTRHQPANPQPPGHLLVAAATIGGLSMIVAAGLELLGFLSRVNAAIAMLVSRNGAEVFPQHLPEWCIWLATAVFAFGLAGAILGSPGHGHRVILWVTAMVVVAAWAPVLSLAAHRPDIAAPWIATLWSGVCSVVYAANHHMDCDPTPPPADDPR